MALSYIEQLSHPNWQKKRLEIFDRDKWSCQICGNTENQLHAHHIVYLKDYLCWEYPDSFIITLCNKCHSNPDIINHITLTAIYIFNGILKLCNNDINELLNSFDGIDYLIGMEDYTENEAFKITLLKLIKHK